MNTETIIKKIKSLKKHCSLHHSNNGYSCNTCSKCNEINGILDQANHIVREGR